MCSPRYWWGQPVGVYSQWKSKSTLWFRLQHWPNTPELSYKVNCSFLFKNPHARAHTQTERDGGNVEKRIIRATVFDSSLNNTAFEVVLFNLIGPAVFNLNTFWLSIQRNGDWKLIQGSPGTWNGWYPVPGVDSDDSVTPDYTKFAPDDYQLYNIKGETHTQRHTHRHTDAQINIHTNQLRIVL